jgi:hypothetical protein
MAVDRDPVVCIPARQCQLYAIAAWVEFSDSYQAIRRQAADYENFSLG